LVGDGIFDAESVGVIIIIESVGVVGLKIPISGCLVGDGIFVDKSVGVIIMIESVGVVGLKILPTGPWSRRPATSGRLQSRNFIY
jgi:hypothetical protein